MSYAVAYSQIVEAVIPREVWDEAYFSLLSLKSHLQSLPGWQRFDLWAQDLVGGDMKLVVVSNWDDPTQLALWVERGMTVDSVLRALKPGPRSLNIDLYEEIA
jgi:hypothetical protein